MVTSRVCALLFHDLVEAVAGLPAQLLLDAHELVVLGHAVGAAHAASLDLA